MVVFLMESYMGYLNQMIILEPLTKTNHLFFISLFLKQITIPIGLCGRFVWNLKDVN